MPVQPVALRYGARRRARRRVVAFGPGESFAANFLRLLGEPPRVAEVLSSIRSTPADAGGRRRIAELRARSHRGRDGGALNRVSRFVRAQPPHASR